VKDAEVYAEVRFDLMRYATALVGVVDAGDLVSAVVARVLARDGGLAGLDDPKPYLMKSVLNEARMRHRSSVRQSRALLKVGAPAEQLNQHDHVLDQIMLLPHRQRAAVFLAYYEQYTPTEIAELMGCRPGTVRRYLHLARGKLKEAFDE
jgi:RNA polymerase sigma factor (sigma-70 family)